MITYHKGDLFALLPADGNIAIAHVCNDVGAWGAGFTRPLTLRYPWAKDSYQYSYRNCLLVPLGRVFFSYSQEPPSCRSVMVAHMVAQHGLPSQSNPHPLDYDALESCMSQVVDDFGDHAADMQLWCPKFGAGIARGDWQRIEQMIERIWQNIDVHVCVL